MCMAPDWSPTTISCWFGCRQAHVTGAFAWKIRCGNQAGYFTRALICKSKPGRRDFASWDPIFLLCNLHHLWTSTYPLPVDINHTPVQVTIISWLRFSLPPENQLSWHFWRCLQSWQQEWDFRRSGRTSWQHLVYIPYIVELKSKTSVGKLECSHQQYIINLPCWVAIYITQTLCADNRLQPACFHQAPLLRSSPENIGWSDLLWDETLPESLDVEGCECKHQCLQPRIWLCGRSQQLPRWSE